MREIILSFVELCSRTLEIPEPIYEFGALQAPGQEKIADLRGFFPGRKYIGADMRPGPGVDVLLNLHEIDLPDASVGTVLFFDTIEHVEFPRKAMAELHRVLHPGGLILMSSVMDFPIHGFPNDYWRFTPEGLRSMLMDFNTSHTAFAGAPYQPHTVVGIGIKAGERENLSAPIEDIFRKWRSDWDDPLTGQIECGWKPLVKLRLRKFGVRRYCLTLHRKIR